MKFSGRRRLKLTTKWLFRRSFIYSWIFCLSSAFWSWNRFAEPSCALPTRKACKLKKLIQFTKKCFSVHNNKRNLTWAPEYVKCSGWIGRASPWDRHKMWIFEKKTKLKYRNTERAANICKKEVRPFSLESKLWIGCCAKFGAEVTLCFVSKNFKESPLKFPFEIVSN